MTKDTWGPPANTGWPEFCDSCGCRRQWEPIYDEKAESWGRADYHLCNEAA